MHVTSTHSPTVWQVLASRHETLSPEPVLLAVSSARPSTTVSPSARTLPNATCRCSVWSQASYLHWTRSAGQRDNLGADCPKLLSFNLWHHCDASLSCHQYRRQPQPALKGGLYTDMRDASSENFLRGTGGALGPSKGLPPDRPAGATQQARVRCPRCRRP